MRRLIQLAAKLYPASWKARYGTEFQALLDDVNPGWHDVFDITKEGIQMQFSTLGFWKIVAALGCVGALAGVIAGAVWPKAYLSMSVLRMESPTGTFLSRNAQIQRMAETVFSRQTLGGIIAQEHLYESQLTKTPFEDVVELMKRNLKMHRVQDGVFSIEFVYGDPVKAQSTIRIITDAFIRANLQPHIEDSLAVKTPGTTLQLLDPASLSKQPIYPNRVSLTVVGLLGGTIIGIFLWFVTRRRALPAA